MPLHSYSPPTPRQEFGLALKAIRERKGVTLAQIAGTTKVPADLFAAFERGDLRRWPKGLFRRAFFRGYAGMIGVRVDETCDEFARLFPDEEAAAPARTTVGSSEEEAVRLALDASWHGPRAAFLGRLLAAFIDAGTVTALGLAAAWIAGVDRPAAIAIVAVTYFSLATVLLSKSPAAWMMARRQAISAAGVSALRNAAARLRLRTGDYSAAAVRSDDALARSAESLRRSLLAPR